MITDPTLHRLQQIIAEPDLTGTKYELLSELGRGGMGIVYLARDTELDREVALKTVDWTNGSEEMSARLFQEAQILARLEHPGIVPVHDMGRLADGRLFYVMKRVQGRGLDAWIEEHRDVYARLGVFLRICDAVSFAHAHGVIHRDLKPENVMIGPFGEVLVLDWGVARLTDSGITDAVTGTSPSRDGGKRRTAHGTVIGTPAYMPPEQATGTRSVDVRADVYALGGLLSDLVDRPRALVVIAGKARALEPQDRYETVAELAADIRRFLEGGPISAQRERLRDFAARVIRRHRVPILLVLAYLVMRGILLWFFQT